MIIERRESKFNDTTALVMSSAASLQRVRGVNSAETMIQFAQDKFSPSRFFHDLQFRRDGTTKLTDDQEVHLVVSFAAL